MGAIETDHIEFEALGEDEVTRRIVAHAFDEPTRANAMRWLNDRAMARSAGVDRRRGRALEAWEVQLREAGRTARAASTVSVLALVAAVVALTVAAEALRRAHVDVRRAETLAEAVADSAAAQAAVAAEGLATRPGAKSRHRPPAP